MNTQKKNISADDRSNLKKANEAYTSCISQDFLSKFLSGENVKVEDFCVKERASMMDLDNMIYGKLPFWLS